MIITTQFVQWNRDHLESYIAKSYPDLYPETQRNILAMGLIPNCKSDLYQFCSSVTTLRPLGTILVSKFLPYLDTFGTINLQDYTSLFISAEDFEVGTNLYSFIF